MYISRVINMVIKIPDNVSISVDGCRIKAKGPFGEVEKIISSEVELKQDADTISLSGSKRMVNTTEGILKNMLNGVTSGYKQKLKIVFAHFPITVEVKGKDIIIKNFLGEKQPRIAKLVGTVKLEIKGQDVTVSGADKDAVGQTIANIRAATKIKEKDGRVFQDGFYPVD